MKRSALGLLFTATPCLFACGGDTESLGNGSMDMGTGGPTDMGAPDAGSGPTDMGAPDAGSPVELSFSEMEIEFGEVQVGSVSQDRSITIENVGDTAIDELTVEPGMDFLVDAFAFSLGQADLPVGASTDLTVVFEPTEPGSAPSTLLVNASAGSTSTQFMIELEGTGTTPEITVTPAEVDFGNVVIGSTRGLEIEVTNQSGEPVTVEFLPDDNVGTCGDGSPGTFCLEAPTPDFDETGSFVVPIGGTRDLAFRFTPTIPGAMEQSIFELRFCPDPTCTAEVELLGIGVEVGLECSPSPLVFGDVLIGSCSNETFTCANVGNGAVSFLGFDRADGTSDEFVPQPSVPSVLDPGTLVELGLQYCPEDAGTDSGAVDIQINSDPTGFTEVSVLVEGQGILF